MEFWSGFTAIVALVTGTVAVISFLSLRRDSRDRTRPLMLAEVDAYILAPGTVRLRIQNIGKSVARNVRVSFVPPIPPEPVIAGFIARRYEQMFMTIGPGTKFTNVYGHYAQGQPHMDEPVPVQFVVRFEYEDSRRWRPRKYKTDYNLDVQVLRNASSSTPSNTDDAGMQRRLVTPF